LVWAGATSENRGAKDGHLLKEEDLTEKQRAWLEGSRKIGPGPMTKSERVMLERLYADMLPAEQQQLAAYIKEKFGKKGNEKEEKHEDDPITKMMERIWPETSPRLREALGKIRTLKPPSPGDKS
jgi:hypothetical protein